jgi:hypothetical protein
VRELFPEAWDAVMDAREPDGDRETARVWALCRHLEERYFPVYEGCEYEQVAYEVPILRLGWPCERLHDLDMRAGELLLLTLCGDPYLLDDGLRVTVLEGAEQHVPPALLTALPAEGLAPSEVRARLDGTRFEAAADFADWIFRDTGLVFLDSDDEDGLVIDWGRETVLELADQWRHAQALLDRVAELTAWLEADPPSRFAELLDALLGGERHAAYLQERQAYACEITEAGLVPVPRGDTAVAVPAGPAG